MHVKEAKSKPNHTTIAVPNIRVCGNLEEAKRKGIFFWYLK
jgi:hypothetical protein